MAAGNVIHAFHDDQDIRHMGLLRAGLPISFWTFLVGTLSITGFPLVTAGFWSKDEIIRSALTGHGLAFWLGLLALLTAGLTAFYMFRLFFVAFGWEWLPHDERHLHEAPRIMTVPCIILAALAVIGGYFLVGNFLEPVFGKAPEVGAVTFWGLALLATVVALIGFLVAFQLYMRQPDAAAAWRKRLIPAALLFEHKYFVDDIYDRVFVRPGFAIGRFLRDLVEPHVIDGTVDGVALAVGDMARDWATIQTGKVRRYAVWTLGGATLIALFVGLLLVRASG
jgi:NADH-quinone oxidoreductase subunit L